MMRRLITATSFAFLLIGLVCPAVAAAEPGCADETVRIQGEIVPAPNGAPCDSDSEDGGGGLLGNAPVVGNLPGLGGVL